MGSRINRRLSTIAVAAAMSPSLLAAGAPQGARENPLVSVTRLRCHFSVTTSVLWKAGKPDVHTEAADLRVAITDINLQDGTAEVSGPEGRRFAAAVLSDGSLYFMETTRGSVDVTTVFAVESAPGKLKAVRAQHEYVYLIVPPFPEDPTATQSYGECEPASTP